jgi:hypothetical protein
MASLAFFSHDELAVASPGHHHLVGDDQVMLASTADWTL